MKKWLLLLALSSCALGQTTVTDRVDLTSQSVTNPSANRIRVLRDPSTDTLICRRNDGSDCLRSAPSKYLWVDNHRIDPYTPDGTQDKPFQNIQAAVDQIITNGDNASFGYFIDIAPGVYAETVTLEDSSLTDIALVGHAAEGPSFPFNDTPGPGVQITALQSTANNDQLANLLVDGISILSSITLTNSTDASAFGGNGFFFTNCSAFSATSTFTNISAVFWMRSSLQAGGSLSLNNVAQFIVDSSAVNITTFAMTFNGANPKPPGATATRMDVRRASTFRVSGGFSQAASNTVVIDKSTMGVLSGWTVQNAAQVSTNEAHITDTVTVDAGGIFLATNTDFDNLPSGAGWNPVGSPNLQGNITEGTATVQKYVDVVENAPGTIAAPASGVQRWFSNGTTHVFDCKTNSGSCAPAGGFTAPNTVGLGGFCPTPGFVFGCVAGSAWTVASTGNANSNNGVWVMQFMLPYTQPIGHAVVNITSGVAGTTTLDVGIYDSNKNRLTYTNAGINAAASGVKNVALAGGTITLSPGIYYFAYCAATTGTITSIGWASLQTSDDSTRPIWNTSSARYATAGNNCTAGALPATLGTLTPHISSASYAPVTLFEP